MNDTYTVESMADGRIRLAAQRLLAKYPFHAHVLERCRRLPSAEVDTMGVTATRSGVLLRYNPHFTLGLPADQLGGVLLHEVLHVVLGHLALDPADYPDRWAFTVAAEVSVNEFVHEPLPVGVIRREQYPMLPAMESTDQRYRRLEKLRGREELGSPSALTDGAGASGPSVLDDHTSWQEVCEDVDADAARKAVADLVQQAAIDAGGLPDELRHAVLAGIGSEAGSGVLVLPDSRQRSHLNWQQLLRRYVGQVLQPQPQYHWPPRRFPHLVGIVPGQRRTGALPSVVAIIDTSGSIAAEYLEQIDGELRQLNRSYPVQVIEADCAVHRVYRYRSSLEHVTGRGGTNFRPALERSLLQPLRPDLLIYFTDGFGPAPDKRPPWPLVWCLVPGGEPPAAYGHVVLMEPPMST